MNSTREAYGQALAELGEKYPIYVFDADLSKATQTVHFAKKFPERFTNMGIAESNMIGYAAGYAACGAIVFASTFAEFAAGRAKGCAEEKARDLWGNAQSEEKPKRCDACPAFRNRPL